MKNMYSYMTVWVQSIEGLDKLNKLYEEGWQFVESVATRPASGVCGVFFTVRKTVSA